MRRIICVGNRYVTDDSAGPDVYERLRHRDLPPGLEVIDGGLAGLDLLRLVEGTERVVFVDSVSGFGRPNEVIVLKGTEIETATGNRYDHAAGLAYLLRVLPQVCEGPVPGVLLVGIEGRPDEKTVDQAATLALNLALGP